jgi:hypothetical protein
MKRPRAHALPFVLLAIVLVVPLGRASAQPCGTGPTHGLVTHYPLNGNATDVKGGRNGTIFGDVVVAPDRFGNPDGAMAFAGSGDYIEADATGLPTGDRTTMFWLFANTVSNRPAPFGYGGGGCGTSWFMGINGGGMYSGRMYAAAHCDAETLLYAYPSPPEGAWHHWAVTTHFSGTRMYLDGQLVASNTNEVTSTIVEGKELSLGVIPDPAGNAPYTDGNVQYLDGRMDDVRVYDRALCGAEIAVHVSSPPPDECVGSAIDLTALGVQSVIELDWVNGELWAADAAANRYVRIDPAIPAALGNVTYPFPIDDHGSEFDASSGRLLHVIDDDEGFGTFDSYAETNLSGGVQSGPHNLAAPSEDPQGLAVDPSSGRVWITTWNPQGQRQIREINRTNGATLQVFGPTAGAPLGLAFYPATGTLLYGTTRSAIYEIGANGSGERKLVDLSTDVGEITGMTVADNGDVWIDARGTNEALLLTCIDEAVATPMVPAMNAWGRIGLVAVIALGSLWSRRWLGARRSIGARARVTRGLD